MYLYPNKKQGHLLFMPTKKEIFSVEISANRLSIQVEASNKQLCDALGKLEFCSRVLYLLRPNHDRVWTESLIGSRVNAHVLGFPPHIKWSRPQEKVIAGVASNPLSQSDEDDLRLSLEGLVGAKQNLFSTTDHQFFIKNLDDGKTYDYSFSSRARCFVAFCVLWDLKEHPRDHLELMRDPKIPFLQNYPQIAQIDTPIKTYGDPSKTVDELRNQGFPRDSDQSSNGSRLEITRSKKYGTSQEHYRLLDRLQSLDDRVGRSHIPSKVKSQLYSRFDYRCNNCGQKYEPKYLAPDHRVPSIVRADNLNASNFLEVLQTLCVRCNQVKRESCKKCPYNHNCDKCAWAYPERNGVTALSLRILQEKALKQAITVEELVKKTFGP